MRNAYREATANLNIMRNLPGVVLGTGNVSALGELTEGRSVGATTIGPPGANGQEFQLSIAGPFPLDVDLAKVRVVAFSPTRPLCTSVRVTPAVNGVATIAVNFPLGPDNSSGCPPQTIAGHLAAGGPLFTYLIVQDY